MQPATREAARALRRSLVRGEVEPDAFRTALARVPVEDRDAWLDQLLDLGELPEDDPLLPRGCVPYLPCPEATVVDALRDAAVTSDDVFVDVGSGMGRTVFLAHLLTGAGCIGLEIQPGLVQAARARAEGLGLERTRFIEGDAVDTAGMVTIGTVFFLYCPFGGSRLQRVLEHLEDIARTRPIRVCTVGLPPLHRPWLDAIPSRSEDSAVYRSTLHRGADELDTGR